MRAEEEGQLRAAGEADDGDTLRASPIAWLAL
jgi:hypothetical protein